MEKTLFSSELYSHPGRPLESHLIKTKELANLFLSEKPPKIVEEFKELVKIIALTHDIGKASSYFQDYLKGKKEGSKETHHSLLSALCAYYIVKEIYKNDYFIPFIAFFSVRRHHGDLLDVIDGILYDDKDEELLSRQLESIESGRFCFLVERLFQSGLPVRLNKDDIYNWIENFKKDIFEIKKYLRGFRKEINQDTSKYIILNLLYSILLDSDKSSAVIKDDSAFRRNNILNSNLIDEYKSKSDFPNTSFNSLREKAYNEITNSCINHKNRVYSINLPTGLGKTLTSLSFALKLRDKLGSNHRIIYSLPFLSIIDQNSNVIESVLETNGIKPESNIFLKHHHLSEIFYKKNDNEFEPDEAKILIEGWNAEIIITTFVQLFHTLISNRNRSLRKFHRLANSIIILDEIQCIPVKYWLLTKEVLLSLSKMLNTYIILVTATEPLIFNRGEIKNLGDKSYYFKAMDRFVIYPHLKRDMPIKALLEHFQLNDGRSYLFIFNTINSAKAFYNLIKDKGIPITFLSTHIVPYERLERIKRIKEGKYKVVVSTQLVEAGVDIDFNVVVRDIAPLDSINQSAGRCNRNGNINQKGEVHIFSLKDENDRTYSSYIYDPVLLKLTREILNDLYKIGEYELYKVVNKYYVELEKRKTDDFSKNLLKVVAELRYDSEDNTKALSSFKLIEDDYPKKDVFIELSEEAKSVWDEYCKLKNVGDIFEKKKKFDMLKSKFYQYVIAIPAYVENLPSLYGELGYVPNSLLDYYYDGETGFKINEKCMII